MSELGRYFDCNATTPMSEAARTAWASCAEEYWQNPSSLYREAGLAKQRLEECREDLADCLGIDEPERIIFTSGATEANNAIIGYFGRHLSGLVAVSGIEHPCVEASASHYLGEARTRTIPVDPESGVIDLDLVSSWIRNREVEAVSVMAANNETGTLQPWSELASLCREQGVYFHSDAAQWIGKLPAGGLGACDFLAGSGHKFGGGKGCGFLVLPEEGRAEDFTGLVGGPQEEGRRAGTENLPAVAAMVTALEEHGDDSLSRLPGERSGGRNAFEEQVESTIGARAIGSKGERLWNTSMILLPHTKNLKWLTRLSQMGFSVSTGSACSAGRGNPSRVMASMGLEFEEMGRVLRLSGGWETTAEDWAALAAALEEVDRALR